ncbi:MAG TPA: hypothetical protein VG409_13500, partial [Actinomycetota bacterium]|nr:hypothetical protein [Actinomycetota bacterium]
MPSRNPRHLAEHRLPWRLMLVAFGLTFAVLAALVASAALVPEEPLVPSAVQDLPAETTSPTLPADPPSAAPSGVGTGSSSSSSSTTAPSEPPPGVSPIALAAQVPASAAVPRATTGTTSPPATPAPPSPPAPTT